MATTTNVVIQQPEELSVKGIKGDIQDQHLGRLRPTSKDTPLTEMKQKLSDDGYLFIKNLIPREDVFHVRKRYV